MSKYVQISYKEMDDFLTELGFIEIKLEGVMEKVYGKLIIEKEPKVTMRIYTSIAHGNGRPCGSDAIRLTLVTKLKNGSVRAIGKSQKVYRIETWKSNLLKKINSWNDYFGPPCPKCKNHTVYREGKWGKFWGCVRFPDCGGTQKVLEN